MTWKDKVSMWKKISDDDMQNLAEKMADDYCEQLFWPSMKSLPEKS